MLEKTNLKSVGRHLQGKAGPQHWCLCGPRKPVHRFRQTLQTTVKAWHGRGERGAPSAAVHIVYHLPPGTGPEEARWGWWGGGQSHGPTAAPPLSPGIKALICGGRAVCRAGVQTPTAGGGEWQASLPLASPAPSPPEPEPSEPTVRPQTRSAEKKSGVAVG